MPEENRKHQMKNLSEQISEAMYAIEPWPQVGGKRALLDFC